MKKITTILTLLIVFNSFGQEIKFGKVSKAELAEKFYTKDSIADAAYIYKFRRTYYKYSQNIGFRVITEFHTRIKIYNKKGFDKATKSITYYRPESGSRESVEDIKGYTYNLVGGKVVKDKLSKKNIFKDRLNKYRSTVKITMPNIKEGSVIEWKYKLVSPYDKVIDDLKFQYDIPVKTLSYKTEIPEWFAFSKIPKGYYPIPFKNSRSRKNIIGTTDLSMNVTTYFASNIPALRNNEPFVSNVGKYRAGMKYELTALNYPDEIPKSFSLTWEEVVKQINKSDRFGGELKRTSFFKDDLQMAIADKTTNIKKIEAILALVKSKIKWNNYNGYNARPSLNKAYKEGLGNVGTMNLLLTAMLREAGFDANPVLVSTTANGVPVSPTLDGFNYVISAVSLETGTILLDAAEEYSAVNILPYRVMNWNGRLINKDGSSKWISLIPLKHTMDDNFMSIKLSDDGIISGMLRTKYTSTNALSYRKRNNELKEEDVISKLEDTYNIEIDNFKVTNTKNVNKPLARIFKFSSEDLIEQINGKLYVNPLLFFTMNRNPFKANERKFPVEFGMPWKDKYTVTIEIPEGYKVESIPEVAALGLPDGIGLFKFQVKQVGNKLKVNSLLQFNQGVILPNYYSQLKEFFKQVVEKQSEKIVFVKS